MGQVVNRSNGLYRPAPKELEGFTSDDDHSNIAAVFLEQCTLFSLMFGMRHRHTCRTRTLPSVISAL